MAKKREKEAKGTDKVEAKKVETKKVMKAETTVEGKRTSELVNTFRKMVNPILGKNKDLTLVENKWGAVQIKRTGSLLFSATKNYVIITHPIFDGKTRLYKHSSSMWDYLSLVPYDKVTQKMLEARVADKKSVKDYVKEFYGKEPEKSGLTIKREAAKKRMEAVVDEAETKKTKKGKDLKRVKEASEKKSDKKIPAKTSKAVRKVAKEVA